MDPEKALAGLNIAILATDYFEYSELAKPKEAFEKAGAKTTVISPKFGYIQGLNHVVKADQIKVDLIITEANPEDYDALLLPGGAVNADNLRVNESAQKFVQKMDELDKPIAVICHGPWLLVSANLMNGRILTSYPTIKDDIKNAGGRWVDFEVVVNDNWLSSRKPDDIPAFVESAILLFANYPLETIEEEPPL